MTVEDMQYTNGFSMCSMPIFIAEHLDQYSMSLEESWEKLLCKQPFVRGLVQAVLCLAQYMHSINMAAEYDSRKKHQLKN